MCVFHPGFSICVQNMHWYFRMYICFSYPITWHYLTVMTAGNKMMWCPSRFSWRIIYSVADKVGSIEIIIISQIPYVYRTYSLESSSTTVEPPTQSLMSEKDGHRVSMSYCHGVFTQNELHRSWWADRQPSLRHQCVNMASVVKCFE